MHFFWGAIDLAVTRFSGRSAPKHPGGAPNCADWVMVEGYSHELASCGFWPGGGEEGAFYAYAYPEPDGYSDAAGHARGGVLLRRRRPVPAALRGGPHRAAIPTPPLLAFLEDHLRGRGRPRRLGPQGARLRAGRAELIGVSVVWPNAESAANSDPWLVANHDRIRLMQPRVLAINFVHGLREPEARRQLETLRVLRESSRWQGYRDPARRLPRLPRDRHRRHDRAARARRPQLGPLPARRRRRRPRLRRAVREPLHDGLRLEELVERGLVHEVWLLADHTDHTAPWETVEVKQTYDEAFRPQGVRAQAGNSGGHSAPWIGRSLRFLFVNFARGVGCAMESLGHSLERMATCGALPYYERYFREYAMLDLDRRFGLPFDSLYGKGTHPVDYPTPTTLRYRHGWRGGRVEDYVPAGGNVHFMPNGRFDYDLDGAGRCSRRSRAGASRARSRGRGGRTVLERYRELAPDCMGRWVVYWRQNMPGLDNRALDDDGRPMKNWWPFLFY